MCTPGLHKLEDCSSIFCISVGEAGDIFIPAVGELDCDIFVA